MTRSPRQERGGYPKTSGGGGLHVFVPLVPGQTFERVRGWVKAMGQQLESTYS
jgi:DNA primase